MRLRGVHHGLSKAARALTLAVVVAASVGQFASLAHEMTVRHFRCAEHGELTHVAASLGEAAASPVAGNALRPEHADVADAHEHCSMAFTLEGSAAAPTVRVASWLPPLPPVPAPAAPILRTGRVVALSAAPKTSPPQA